MSKDTQRAFGNVLKSAMTTSSGDTEAQDREAAQMIAKICGTTPQEALAEIRRAERSLYGK
ncbi:hypothetical protein [Streptosporangium sp. NPDC004631]